MNQRTSLALVIMLASLTVTGAMLLHSRRDPLVHNEDGLSGEIEGTENPGEQAHWDWVRLRDPKTGRIPDGIRERELVYGAKLPTRESMLAKSTAEKALAETQWQARGPFNVGGRTRALAVDVTSPATVLAGGITGGMWRSTNSGGSWLRTTRADQHPAVSCVAQDIRPGHTNTWYYGTGEYYGNSGSATDAKYTGDGIYTSTDQGQSWRILPSTHSGSVALEDNSFDYVWGIAPDPSNTVQDELYAAVYGGIKRSTDGGGTWTDALGSLGSGSAFTDVAVTHTGVVYATLSNGSQGGIWRSADGVTWKSITPANWPSTYSRIVIGIAPSNENVVYFLGETPNGGLRVGGGSGTEWHSFWKYTYTNGDGSGTGGAWESRSNNLPPASGIYGGYHSQHSYDMVIRVKPDDENTVFIGGTNLYRSANGFATAGKTSWIGGYAVSGSWIDFTYPNHHPDQHSLAFDPSNSSILYSGCDGGITRCTDDLADTVVWESLNHGYRTTQVYALSIDHGTPGDNTIVVGMQDNSSWMTRSANPSDPWMQVGPGDGTYCAVADSGAAYYVSSQGGRIYRVGFAGDGTPAGFVRIDPSGAPAYLFVNPFTLDPSDNKILYHLSGSTVWRNTNAAGIPLDSSLTSKSLYWARVNSSNSGLGTLSAIGVSTQNPAHRIYIGTTSGDVATIDNADKFNSEAHLVSGDFGSGYVSSIAVDPQDGNKAMVVLSNYGIISLFYTTDGGGNWAPVAGNLEANADGTGDGPSCRWASILHSGSQTIYYVGTSTGLYSTTNLNGAGTVWVQEGVSTIGNVIVDMIDVRQSDGLVAVGTHGNGVFTAMLGSLGVHNQDVAASGQVVLEGNVPNPVRGSTTISFTLGSAATVRLALYDIAGREVRRMLDRVPLTAGRHTVAVDVADQGAGAYVYQLEALGERRMGRMVVGGK